MGKIKKVIKFEDLPVDVMEALDDKFPDGWEDQIRKITKPNGDYFFAIDIDTETISYLAKIDMDVDIDSYYSDVDKQELDFTDKNAEKAAAKHSKDDGEDRDDEDDDE
ncbi:MAG: hypothetical protein K8S16_18515 [Bacteroidales bacterium]|nr:hypothetical protein [Bacteroidales bacterium]